MYCNNCQCVLCVAKRSAPAIENRVQWDVIRLLTKAKESGMTMSELCKFSRAFRMLSNQSREVLLETLVSQGVLLKHRFPPESGRGRYRDAFLCSEI